MFTQRPEHFDSWIRLSLCIKYLKICIIDAITTAYKYYKYIWGYIKWFIHLKYKKIILRLPSKFALKYIKRIKFDFKKELITIRIIICNDRTLRIQRVWSNEFGIKRRTKIKLNRLQIIRRYINSVFNIFIKFARKITRW